MIKLGIVGANDTSRKHLECLKGGEDFEIIGLFDHDPLQAARFCEQHGLKQFLQYDALLQASEAINIQTPVGMHYRYASQAIMQSVHVMVSGLLSEDIREARHINELAVEAQVNVKVLHHDKLHPEVKTLKRITRKPVYIECNRFQNKVLSISNDSIIFGALLNDIELLCHLVGSPVRKVNTNATRIYNDFVDFVNVRIDFENGCVANMNCGNFENGQNSFIRIFQRNECIRLDLDTFKLIKLIRTESGDFAEVPFHQNRTKPEDVVKMELQQFAQSIKNRQKTSLDTYQTFESLRIAHQVIERIHPSTLFNA
ncbi:MAG: Gfo/Idh/MocA family oxidoreductase [Bacteroidia bacterium]|jgi:predicted dehydrogenase